jgi:hypothetical protein
MSKQPSRGTKVILCPRQRLSPTRGFIELVTWRYATGYATPLRNSRSQLSWYISKDLPVLRRPSADDFLLVDMQSVQGPFATKSAALEALGEAT